MTRFNLCLAALALFVLALGACTKTGASKEATQRDFDRFCKSQKDFLEASKLKGVDVASLKVERAKRMGEGLETEAAFKVMEVMATTGQTDQKALVEKAAKEAGLDGWTCPELGQGQ